jgi:hypothetical protein
MQQTLHHPMPICKLMAHRKPIFKVFIACENQGAFFQAQGVPQQVAALCGDDFEISRVFWNFALLRNEELRGHASRDAADAQMIVISLRGNHELPHHVKRWVESWPARAQAGQTALVTLVAPEQETWAESQADVAYLREMAEGRRMDFFCNRDGGEQMEFSKPISPRLKEASLAQGNSVSYEIVWNRGGINE